MLEAVGVDRIVCVTAHDLAAFQNSFRCQSEHLDAYAPVCAGSGGATGGTRVAVVSPDPGGEKRAELFRPDAGARSSAPVGKALVDKSRARARSTGDLFAGDVEGRTAIVLDDMISTGGTMIRAAQACLARGAAEAIAVATHGLFVDGGTALLSAPAIEEIWVTDSLPAPASLFEGAAPKPVRIVPLGPLLAGVIQRCHAGGSINQWLGHGEDG